jgi:hypothetical protein
MHTPRIKKAFRLLLVAASAAAALAVGIGAETAADRRQALYADQTR